jgi:hypothetical protein
VEVTPASYGVSIQAFHFWYVISPTFPMEPKERRGKDTTGKERTVSYGRRLKDEWERES